MVWKILGCLLLGFFFGGWNGAIIVSRLRMHEDVREKGSGNAGLTNFLRSYGGWATLLVVGIDFGKTVAACLIATLIFPEQKALAKMLAGLAVQIGHIFPMYYGFQGGKGVLCSAAVALVMNWRIFAIDFPLFVLVFFITRYVSLGSLIAAIGYSVLFVLFFPKQPEIWILAIGMSLIMIFMHRSNIGRLLHGQERKTHFHKEKNK